ncbi:MAG: glycosyltransferase family 2 protein [Cyclobacteriaceae bacterium]|jgi:glycosyltransferase involved in cell wall biosynthesis|nr:glycosyltransferase family 2 protein [Cyclobacteriaceae bacterium]
MAKISAVIITLNEERNIARCLDSLMPVADDILVVDSYSTDLTEYICRERGVRFIQRKFTTYSEQKNFAVGQARYDNILSLDADEYLSPELIQSILAIKETWTTEAYRMNRLSSYAGKWIHRGSWYPNRQLRLWNRNHGRWNDSNPHEVVVLDNGMKPIQLNGDLMHRSYANASEALQKIQLYSTLYAESKVGKKKVNIADIMFHSGWAFFKSYFYKLGFMDGYHGLMVAKISAAHTLFKYVKLYEANQGWLGGKTRIWVEKNLVEVAIHKKSIEDQVTK